MPKSADMTDRPKESLLVRKTRSVCSICLKELEADIVQKDDAVVMQKYCPEHGNCSVLLSREKKFYVELSRAYFKLMPKDLVRRNLSVTLTPRCSLRCPVCYVIKTMGNKIKEMSMADLEKVLKDNPDNEFMFWGMEPTEHPHIDEIFRLFKKHNKECYMLSNGLRLQDQEFLKKLRASGLSHVYLQFDGFDDNAYKIIRGRELLKEKIKILDNLKQLDVPVSLEVILARGVNDEQISKIIEYAVKNSFIRQITFMPLVDMELSGKSRDGLIVPGYHESLKAIEEKTSGRINLDKLRAFQKILYVVYRFTGFRRCIYFISFILVRDTRVNGYKTIDEFIDLEKAEKIIDASLDKLKGVPGFIFDLKLAFNLLEVLFNRRCLGLIFQYVKFVLRGRKIKHTHSAKSFLFLTYNEFCDNYKMDIGMSELYCQDCVVKKNEEGNIVYTPCYREVIESCKDLLWAK